MVSVLLIGIHYLIEGARIAYKINKDLHKGGYYKSCGSVPHPCGLRKTVYVIKPYGERE